MKNETTKNLTRVCRQAIESRYGFAGDGHDLNNNQKAIIKRLEFELDWLAEHGGFDYLCTIFNILKFMESQRIQVMPSRGEAPGSLVAYLIGASSVDPVKFKMPPELFLAGCREGEAFRIHYSDHGVGPLAEYAYKICGHNGLALVARNFIPVDFAQVPPPLLSRFSIVKPGQFGAIEHLSDHALDQLIRRIYFFHDNPHSLPFSRKHHAAAKFGVGNLEELILYLAMRPLTSNSAIANDKEVFSRICRIKQGEEQIACQVPALLPFLGDTYGELAYQEQVVDIIGKITGWDILRANRLRKMLNTKQVQELEQDRDEFLKSDGRQSGFSQESRDQIFQYLTAKTARTGSKAAAALLALEILLMNCG